MIKASVSNRVWVIVTVAVLGIAGSIIISRVVHDRERRLLESRFNDHAHDRVAAINLKLQATVSHVRSIAGLFVASTSVEKGQFQSFATSILAHEPAIQALGYDAVVELKDRAAHEARIQQQGNPDYRITERTADGSLVVAAERPVYVPVSLLEPLEGNEAALGYDIASEPSRREALDRASESGLAAITEPIVLVQERAGKLGALITVPVYSARTPLTVGERRETLRGFAVGVVRVDDLVSHALAGLRPIGVHLRVLDEAAPEEHRLLHVHVSRTVEPDSTEARNLDLRSAGARRYDFEIAGRRWTVEATPTAAFVDAYTTRTPLGVLLAGLLATSAMVFYLWRQAAANARLRSAVLAKDHAEELLEGFGRVLDESFEEVYVVDAGSLRFLHANRGARTNLGYTLEELRSMTPLDLTPNGTTDSLSSLLQPLQDGTRNKIDFTTVHRRKDGSQYDAEIHLQMTSFDGGPAFVAVVLDISERIRLEERQRQSQKLEALGTLAGGTAHDVNNLLTAIMGYTELCQMEVPPDSNARNHLREVLKASERARDVVRQILTFSRSKPTESRSIDLRDIAGEVLKLIRSSLPATIAIDEDLVDGCTIRGDSSQIYQVLMNVCTNAAQAIGGRHGKLAVSVDTVELDVAEAAELGDLDPGAYARIQVRDDGEGIPGDTLERIFDPFFTTKKLGEGTGMGLSVAHGIVKGHGGAIRVASEVNRGTVFSIYLPRIESLTLESPNPAATPVSHGGSILVVDDEPSIRELLAALLSASGYDVETCADGAEALEVIRGRSEDFDLVITDYTMPRMTGTTLAREIHRLFPDLPVVLVSGYGDLIAQDEVRGSGVRELLNKPVRREELHTAIRALGRVSPRERELTRPR